MTWETLMRVKFVQSGGVVGVLRGCELESSSLAPEDARELESLVVASGLVESGEFHSPAGRDLRSYEILLDRGQGVVAVTFDDGTMPEKARPLVSFLRRNSKPTGRA